MLVSKEESCNCKLGFPVLFIDSGGNGLVEFEKSGQEVSGQWANGPVDRCCRFPMAQAMPHIENLVDDF